MKNILFLKSIFPAILLIFLMTSCAGAAESADEEGRKSSVNTTTADTADDAVDSRASENSGGVSSDNSSGDEDLYIISTQSVDEDACAELKQAPDIQPQTIVSGDVWCAEITNYSQKLVAENNTVILNYESQELEISNSKSMQSAENVTEYLAQQTTDDGELYEDIAAQAETYFAEDMAGEDFGGYYYSLTYNAAESNGLLSIIKHTRSYFGGVHDSFYETAMVFDGDGNRMYIDDLFTDPQSGSQAVVNYITTLIDDMDQSELYEKEMYSQLIPDLFSDEYQTWYLSDDGIEIICNPYTIAPYAAGSFYFTVPYSAIEGWSELVGIAEQEPEQP